MKKILPILALLLASCGPDPAIPLPSKRAKFKAIYIGDMDVGRGSVVKVEGTVVTLNFGSNLYTVDWMRVTSTKE